MVRAVDVSVEARDFVALFGKTSQVEKALKTALRRNIRTAAKGVAAQVQAEVQKPPDGGIQGSSSRRRDRFGRGAKPLRATIAKGIKVQILTGATSKRVGVYIKSTGDGLYGDRKKLARSWERGKFRHPVFGNRGKWVSQAGHPYFRKTIQKNADTVRAAVQAAMDEAARSLK